MDNQMTLSSHVDSVCQSANLALRDARDWTINLFTAETLVHGWTTATVFFTDYLIMNFANINMCRKQLQEWLHHIPWKDFFSGSMVAYWSRSDHIFPVLRRLHWLPVKHRITFKVNCLLLTYRALHGLAR